MSEKYQKTCKYSRKHSDYVEHLVILAATVTSCVSISAFSSLICVPVGIMSFSVGTKTWAIAAGIKNCKSIIKKKNKKHNEIVLLGKDTLNTIEVLISKVLIDSYVS